MYKLWIILPLLLLFLGCKEKTPTERISILQERIDAIAKKVESGEGLKARRDVEDIEIAIKNLKSSIDELNNELKGINKRLDELNTKYIEHLEKFHQ